MNIREESTNPTRNIKFLSGWEGPNVMSVCISEHDIVFVTGVSVNGWCPNIQMNNLEREKINYFR
jgi:hypothetical protein